MSQGVSMAGTGVASLTPATFAYDRRLLERLKNSFVYVGFGTEKKLEANMGTTITFRRYNNLSAATTPLVEGVTPAGSSISKADITCAVYQVGDFVTYTDWVDMVGVDGKVVKIIDELQADQVADTFDQLMRDVMVASTNVRVSTYTTVTAPVTLSNVDTIPVAGDFAYIQNFLERRNVKPLKEKTLPGVQVATQGLDAAYIAICHPDLRPSLENATLFPNFVPVSKYPANAKIMTGEIGQMGRIKFLATTNAPIVLEGSTTAISTTFRGVTYADVYKTVVFGAGAFGNVKLTKGALSMIVKPLGYKDPLNQEGSVGWKGTFGALILDQSRVVTLYHLCAQL